MSRERDTELRRLERMAINIAQIKETDSRLNGGMLLDHELRDFDTKYKILTGIDPVIKSEFMAVVRILVDFILHDQFDDEDWTAIVPNAIEDGFDVTQLLRKDPNG